MALTKAFRATVYERAQRDAGFRKALLTEAMNAYLGGDEATGKAEFLAGCTRVPDVTRLQ